MGKEGSPVRMQRNDRVQIVMAREKASAPGVGALKKSQLNKNNNSGWSI
jgi:hypothetical protein